MKFLFAFQNHYKPWIWNGYPFHTGSCLCFLALCEALPFEQFGTGVKVDFWGIVPFDLRPESPSVPQQRPRALWRGPPWQLPWIGWVVAMGTTPYCLG